MPSDTSYLRCRHCRGFYETSCSKCKWCGYDDPVPMPDGRSPRVYPDRATCRALQLAEFEQLPPEARADPFKPPADSPDLRCACLHCGPDGHLFEAVEMRWMANEQTWACPCTTCGGRGFGFDIHPFELRWQCAECEHFFAPPDGRYVSANAVCPKCGSPQINGWFDDEFDDDDADEFDDDDADGFEDEDADDEDDDESFDDDPALVEPTGAAPEAPSFPAGGDAGPGDAAAPKPKHPPGENALPWESEAAGASEDARDTFFDDDDDRFFIDDDDRDEDPYGLARDRPWQESQSAGAGQPGSWIPDDIDYPRADRRGEDFSGDDDIPF